MRRTRESGRFSRLTSLSAEMPRVPLACSPSNRAFESGRAKERRAAQRERLGVQRSIGGRGDCSDL